MKYGGAALYLADVSTETGERKRKKIQELCSKPVELTEFDCCDPLEVRICAHYIPTDYEHDFESVEDIEVDSAKFYELFLLHDEGKSMYFQRCVRGLCSHDDLLDCRSIARYHMSNLILMKHIQNCEEDGVNYTEQRKLNKPSFTEMTDFDYICSPFMHVDVNDQSF